MCWGNLRGQLCAILLHKRIERARTFARNNDRLALAGALSPPAEKCKQTQKLH